MGNPITSSLTYINLCSVSGKKPVNLLIRGDDTDSEDCNSGAKAFILDLPGKKVSSSFLMNSLAGLFFVLMVRETGLEPARIVMITRT